MEDRALIELYWARDEAAIQETAAKYGRLCACVAGNVLRSAEDREECVNDTYFAVWNAIPVQRPQRFSVFISRITRNLALKKWEYLSAARRNGSAVLSLEELGECVPGGSDAQAAMESHELVRLLNRFLADLPAPQRQVFLARYWYGAAVKDIARQFGFSESKVKSMLHRTREKLRLTLEKEGY